MKESCISVRFIFSSDFLKLDIAIVIYITIKNHYVELCCYRGGINVWINGVLRPSQEYITYIKTSPAVDEVADISTFAVH